MTQTRTSEEGSMAMVLLVAIIMAGAIIALFTTVTTGGDTARRDRDWQSAVQVADAGIQQAFVNLRDLEEGDTLAPCDPGGTGRCSGTIGQGTFTWDYELLPGSETQWEVSSRGEVGGSQRLLRAEVGPRQVFPVAMLAKKSLTYDGGGTGSDPFSVGSFGSITLNGTPANDSVESIVTYGPGPHDITAGSQQITSSPQWNTNDLTNLAAEAFNDDALCGGGVEYDVYPTDVPTPGVRGEVYCVGRVNFSSGSHPLSGPAGQAVEVYVRNSGSANSFQVRTGANVNAITGGPGEPAEHLFFIESGPVVINANSAFAGGIYAPNSSCNSVGNPEVTGSVVCNEIRIGGNFGFSDALSGVTKGPTRVNRYWEDPAGS